MDNPYYDWSPLPARRTLRWPNDARVAVCFLISLEHLEWEAPPGAFVPPSAVFGGAYPAVFDSADVSLHEYGNRVGFFRVARLLDAHQMPATVAIDAALVALAPRLVNEVTRRNWEVMGHGISMTRMITEQMDETTEREYIDTSLRTIGEAVGEIPVGWVGADYGESSRTVRLLGELGVKYVCDWPNDEQPYRMTVPVGDVVSLPVCAELDDVYAHRVRFITPERWSRAVIEAFDRLYDEGASSGRTLILNLHPYVCGQPFRAKYLEQVIEHIARHEHVWCARARDIVGAYLSHEGSAPAPPVESPMADLS